MGEEMEQQNKWIIHPHNKFRKWWLIVILIVTFVNVIIIPLAVSFFTEEYHYSTPWIAVNVVIDLLFLIDIVLNFWTGITDDTETVILDPKIIRCQYLKTWFFPDLLAVAPVDYCLLIVDAVSDLDLSSPELAGIRVMRLIKLSRLFSLLRLLRFSRLLRYTRDWEEMAGWNAGGIATALNITHMVVGIGLVCHWNSCFQFLCADLMDFPEKSWVVVDGLLDKPLRYQYTKSMFRSLCQMLAVNYGAMSICQGLELWITIISMTVGRVMYILILALMARTGNSDSLYDSKYNELKHYMRHHRFPAELRHKLFEHLKFHYQGNFFEDSIQAELSEPLRKEVMRHSCLNLVSNTPMFQDASPLLVANILQVLVHEVFTTGDLIMAKGELGQRMYFIKRGEVQVETDTSVRILLDGDFFGERCLVNGSAESTVTAKALTPCRLYSLSYQDYKRVLTNYPELKVVSDTLRESTEDEDGVPNDPFAAADTE